MAVLVGVGVAVLVGVGVVGPSVGAGVGVGGYKLLITALKLLFNKDILFVFSILRCLPKYGPAPNGSALNAIRLLCILFILHDDEVI